MKIQSSVLIGLAAAPLCILSTGCREIHPDTMTSSYHPGPLTGRAVGATAGVAVGEAGATVVGAVEGAGRGLAAPFDPTVHVVRRWHTETTWDGRTVQVPKDILVDKYGRPVVIPVPDPKALIPLVAPALQPLLQQAPALLPPRGR
jgi:hypothetical protein